MGGGGGEAVVELLPRTVMCSASSNVIARMTPDPLRPKPGQQQDTDQYMHHCIADTLPTNVDETEIDDQGPEHRLERPATEGGLGPMRWRRALAKLIEIIPKEWAETGVEPSETFPNNSRPNLGISWRISSLTTPRQLNKLTLSIKGALKKAFIFLHLLLHTPP